MLGGFLEQREEACGHEVGAHDVGGVLRGPFVDGGRVEEVLAECFGGVGCGGGFGGGDAGVVDEDVEVGFFGFDGFYDVSRGGVGGLAFFFYRLLSRLLCSCVRSCLLIVPASHYENATRHF